MSLDEPTDRSAHDRTEKHTVLKLPLKAQSIKPGVFCNLIESYCSINWLAKCIGGWEGHLYQLDDADVGNPNPYMADGAEAALFIDANISLLQILHVSSPYRWQMTCTMI